MRFDRAQLNDEIWDKAAEGWVEYVPLNALLARLEVGLTRLRPREKNPASF
jgi:hypothetical protein